jgi:hypothetical protein
VVTRKYLGWPGKSAPSGGVQRIDLGPRGVCLRKDAVAGAGRYQVREALRLGEVVAPFSGVLVDAARATEPLTYLTAAWLSAGTDALLTGPSAAYLHGISALPPTPVHLVLPYEHRKWPQDGIVFHNGTAIDEDRDERHGLPVLGLERVIADLLCTVWPPKALSALDETLAQLPESDRPAFRRRLRDRLQNRPDPRGTRIGRRLVDLATGRAESPPESWLLWLVVDLGFPVPKANLPICGIDGREIYRLDLGYEELRIAIEYNGHAAHVDRVEHDKVRLRDLERRGWIVIVVDADDLYGPARLEKELHEAFLSRGVVLGARTTRALRPLPHRGSR